jgi:hypothetical protein
MKLAFKKYLVSTTNTGVDTIVGNECFDDKGNVIPDSEIQKLLPVFQADKVVQEKERQIREDMRKVLGGMDTAETLTLMFKYMGAKMATLSGSADAPLPTIPLTPTGEDLIVWGDRIATELEDKLIELRKL